MRKPEAKASGFFCTFIRVSIGGFQRIYFAFNR